MSHYVAGQYLFKMQQMSDLVLLVDESMMLFETAKELFRTSEIEIQTVGNMMEALEIVACRDVGVVVLDNCLPEICGLNLLNRLKETVPETVKILMTDHADLPIIQEVVNQSEVYRIILKPWKEDDLIRAVYEGIRHHRDLQVLRKGEENVLSSIMQAIELKDPYTRAHCDRVSNYAFMIADELQLPNVMKKDIKCGSQIHDCGKIGISETILKGSQLLNSQELAAVRMHTDMGANLASKANLSRIVRNIILYHHERFDGAGYPAGMESKEIPLEARIVAVADVFDALIHDRSYRKRYSLEEAVDILMSMRGNKLDPEIVEIFLPLITKTHLPLLMPDTMKMDVIGNQLSSTK